MHGVSKDGREARIRAPIQMTPAAISGKQDNDCRENLMAGAQRNGCSSLHYGGNVFSTKMPGGTHNERVAF